MLNCPNLKNELDCIPSNCIPTFINGKFTTDGWFDFPTKDLIFCLAITHTRLVFTAIEDATDQREEWWERLRVDGGWKELVPSDRNAFNSHFNDSSYLITPRMHSKVLQSNFYDNGSSSVVPTSSCINLQKYSTIWLVFLSTFQLHCKCFAWMPLKFTFSLGIIALAKCVKNMIQIGH